MDLIENIATNSSSTVVCVFVAAGTSLLSCCVATIWGHRQTDRQRGDLSNQRLFFQSKKI
jgi:hypothetical protein